MKFLTLTPAITTLLLSFLCTSVTARPLDVSYSALAARKALNVTNKGRALFDVDLNVERRGAGFSKPAKDPERKAKYDTGNPKPETPVGEFRQHTAGKKDDYFGDWQTMTKGVNNPAAGKGKKSKRGAAFSKPKADPDRKAKYDTGNPKPETPVGEFRQHTAGKKDDYFGDWQTMTKGVNNPAAGKGKKSKRGAAFSKPKADPDRKAKYDTGNPKPETPVGEFRQHTAGKKDDYFGDWQTMTKGVDNPAAGKGKKSKRGAAFSKPKADPDRKAKYDTGNPKPETPVGEFRQHTAGKKDDYFGDWQTMTKGVNNPAAGKGKKSKRGAAFSKPKADPDRKAKYDTGNPKPETPVGEFRQHTAGKKDDYFGDWQTMTKGVNNPAAGKGKKSKRGAAFSKPKADPDRKAKYDTGNPKPETPVGEFRQHTAGKKDDYFGDWQTMTKGVNNPAAGKGKKSKRDFDIDDYELFF